MLHENRSLSKKVKHTDTKKTSKQHLYRRMLVNYITSKQIPGFSFSALTKSPGIHLNTPHSQIQAHPLLQAIAPSRLTVGLPKNATF